MRGHPDVLQRSVLLLVILGIAACAGIPPPPAPDIPLLKGFSPAEFEHSEAIPTPEEIFSLSEPMQEFLETFVEPASRRGQQIVNLESAVHHPGSLGIRYDPAATLTVAETFRQQRGNCLSLSLMFAAMARSLGISARFQEVVVEPHWDLEFGVVFSTRHINVASRVRYDKYILDFYRAEPGRKVRPMRALSDSQATGQFYNNLGAGAMAENDLTLAWAFFREAVRYSPHTGYLWSNFGVLFNRNDQPDVAESFFRYAIALDPDDTASYVNLANLLERQGDAASARSLRDQVESLHSSNPYYWFARAESAEEDGQHEAAFELIDKAIELGPREAIFYEYGAKLAEEQGLGELMSRYLRAQERAR